MQKRRATATALFAFLISSGCVSRHASTSPPVTLHPSIEGTKNLIFSASIPRAASGWMIVARESFDRAATGNNLYGEVVAVSIRNRGPVLLGVSSPGSWLRSNDAGGANIVLLPAEEKVIFRGTLGEFVQVSQSVSINRSHTDSNQNSELQFEVIFRFPDSAELTTVKRLRLIDTNSL